MKLTKQTTKGFTLVESLIGVGILAMLASGMWVAVASYQNKKLVKKAEAEIALLAASMTEYRTDNGGLLPFGRGDEESSAIMYRALSCDDDGDGEPTVVKVTGFAESAFSGKTNLKAVQFNKGITNIPNNAFAGCSSLVRNPG